MNKITSIGIVMTVLLAATTTAFAASQFETSMQLEGVLECTGSCTGDDPWNNTGLTLSQNNESAANQFNVDNTGDYDVDVKWACANTADWSVGAAVGLDTFRLQAKGSGAYVNLANAGTTIQSNLLIGNNQNFQFKVYTPSSVSQYDKFQSATVSFSCIAH